MPAGRLEIFPGADLDADPLTWTATDITADVQNRKVVINRGRRSPGAQTTEPASFSVTLSNEDGTYTPYKASSPHYPNLDIALPVRHSVNAGARYLDLTGATSGSATTPDAASWVVGADLGLAIQFVCPLRFPPTGSTYEVVGQSTIAGNQRSWLAYIPADGALQLRVSPDGTNESDRGMSIPIPRPDAGYLTIALEFDGDNGASGNTTTFYVCKGTIADLVADKTLYTFGDPDIESGTFTFHNSTGLVGIGDVPGAGFSPYPGGIAAVLARAGTLTTGTVMGNPDFTTQTVGAGSFADTAGTPKTWTINAPASISDKKTTMVGIVEAEEMEYPGQAKSDTPQITWTVNGPLARMRRFEGPLQSALYRTLTTPVSRYTVEAYFPLEDGSAATSIFSPIGGTGAGSFTLPLAVDDSLDSSQALPSISGGSSYGWNLPFTTNDISSGWEYTHVMRLPTMPGSGDFVEQRIDTVGGTTVEWVYRIDNLGWTLYAKDGDGTNVLAAAVAADVTYAGAWTTHTVKLVQSGGNINYTVQVTEIDTGSSGLDTGTLVGYTMGSPRRFRAFEPEAASDGFSIGHFLITTGMDVGDLAPADSAFKGEPDARRVARLCAEEGVVCLVDGPYSEDWDEAFAAGGVPMGPQRPGVSLLGLIDECAVASNGYYGEARELFALTYRSGCTTLNQTPRITLTSEITSPLRPTRDLRDFVNIATGSRPNGSKVERTATGNAAPSLRGRYPLDREANLHTDGDLPAWVEEWLHEATWEALRYGEIPIELAKNPTKIDQWRAVSMGDVLEATSLPAAEPETSFAVLLEGWVEEIDPHLWTVRANGVPAGPRTFGTLDDNTPSTSLARFDTDGDTTSLTGSLSSSATGGQSVTVVGTLWTTSAAQFPLDIVVGGERITLSGISGASSPQTFTISARSVNGVVKAHSAGAVIHPWFPLRFSRTRSSQ